MRGLAQQRGAQGRCRGLFAGLAVGAVVVTSGCAAEGMAGEVDDATSTSPEASSSVHPVTTVVVTDDPAYSAAGSSADGTWPALLAANLADEGGPLELTSAAAQGAGFAPDDPSEPSFTDLVVERVDHSTQLVVFFETAFGSADARAVGDGAAAAFKSVEEAAPDAVMVVVGPYRASADAPEPTDEVRGALRDAAHGAEAPATYVDPVAERWPVAAGQQQIADLLTEPLAPLAKSLAESGAFD
jgi:hypothetical protein